MKNIRKLFLVLVSCMSLAQANDQQSAFFDAVRAGDVAQVQVLIEDGADINDQSKSEYGFTPLIVAVMLKNITMVQLLLENGADVNLQDIAGAKALHIVQSALQWYPNVNCESVAVETELFNIIKRCNDIIALLKAYGA